MRHSRRSPTAACLAAVALLVPGLGPVAVWADPPDSVQGPASPEEGEALERAKRRLAAGEDANAILDEDVSLLGRAAMEARPLHVAAERGWTALARFLLENGADPRAQARSKGVPALLDATDVALASRRAEVVRLLHAWMLPRVGAVESISCDAAGRREVLLLVSFETGRWSLVTESMEGTWVDADVLIDPSVPKAEALTRRHGVFEHVGEDVALAVDPGGRGPRSLRAPPGIAWGDRLGADALRKGSSFLVRASSGAVFSVEIESLDRAAGRIEFRRVRLATDESPAPDRTAGATPPGQDPAGRRAPPAPSPETLTASLFAAAASGDLDGVKRLLGSGVDPSRRGPGGGTALHVAAARGHVAVARALFQDVESRVDEARRAALDRMTGGDDAGLTPLHLAAHRGHAAMVRALLEEHGMDVDLADRAERTAAHLAAMAGAVPVLEVLRRHGARLRVQDAAGDRPEDLTEDPRIAAWFASAATPSDEVETRQVRLLVEEVMAAVEAGDRERLARRVTEGAASSLPARLGASPGRHEVRRLRVGARRGEAEVDLVTDGTTPVGREFRFHLGLVREEAGRWRVASVAIETTP
jgi:ankyrin repeat protein